MTKEIKTSGLGTGTLEHLVHATFKASKPKVVGVAIAYVSKYGFDFAESVFNKYGVTSVRLVADTRDAITQPKALEAAKNAGWQVRIVDSLPGTFHPKMWIGGNSFSNVAGVAGVSHVLIGSGNLSAGGLKRNAECSFATTDPSFGVDAARAWKECWSAGKPLTNSRLTEYEKRFEARNKQRDVRDLYALGVTEQSPPKTLPKPKGLIKPPPVGQGVIATPAATAVWAGLETFTGEYDLQLEFPKLAGDILRRLVAAFASGGIVPMLCDDGKSRDFIYKYYPNAMHRLSIKNDTPNAAWARANHTGIAVVNLDLQRRRLTFSILRPGSNLNAVVRRSVALGTWGKTPTRLYGWY